MTVQEISDSVKEILVDLFELDEKEVIPDASLYEELGLDSLDSVDLVVALEKKFAFKIVRNTDEEKIRKIRLVKDIHSFIIEKIEDAEKAVDG